MINKHQDKVKTLLSVYKMYNGWIALILITLFGVYLRLDKLFTATSFYGDQGSDLLIASRIVQGISYPLVGGVVSLQGFLTPPTHFYFQALLLFIFKSVEGMLVAYVTINLIAIGLVCYIAFKEHGLNVGILTLFFLMISERIIFQAKTIWNPHPIFFFQSISLFFYYLAFQKKKLFFLLLGVFFHFLSATNYISGILMIPFFFVLTYKFFYSRSKRFVQSILIALFLFLVVSIFFHIPVLYILLLAKDNIIKNVVENSHEINFFTLVWEYTVRYFSNIHLFILSNLVAYLTFSSNRLLFIISIFFFFTVVIYILKKRYTDQSNTHIFSSRLVIFLPFSFVLLAFYTGEQHPHRMISILPFFFVYLSIFLNQLVRKNMFYKTIVFVIILFFMIANLVVIDYRSGVIKDVFLNLSLIKNLVKHISYFKAKYSISSDEYSYHLFTRYDEWDWEASSVLFFLWRDYGYVVEFTSLQNDLVRTGRPAKNEKYAILTCVDKDVNYYKKCLEVFLTRAPEYYVIDEFVNNINSYEIFVLKNIHK